MLLSFNFARYNDEHQLSFMLDEKYSLLLNESPCFVKNQAKELLAYIGHI